jgi:hypothetical protein
MTSAGERGREVKLRWKRGVVAGCLDLEDFFQLFLLLETRCGSEEGSEFGGIGDVFYWIWTLLNLVLSVFGGPWSGHRWDEPSVGLWVTPRFRGSKQL